MSHVAEGELHAWLDGALDQVGERRAQQVREHLRHCAECQQRLGAEEALRARATEVLGLAAPLVVDMPPLEALVERARSAPAPAVARPTRLSSIARLGWAASVMAALGAGWNVHELWIRRARGEDTVVPTIALAPVPSPSAAAQATGTGSTAGAAESRSTAPARVAASQPTARGAARENAEAPPGWLVDVGPSAAAAKSEAVPAPVEQVADLPTVERGTPADVGADALPPEDRVVEAPAPPTVDRSSPTSSQPAQSSVGASLGFSPGASPRSPAAPPAAERTPAGRTAPGRQERSASSSAPRSGAEAIGIKRAPSESTRSDVPDLFVEGRNRQRATTPRVTKSDGQADVDEALDLIVPGLDVLRVEWTEVVPGQRGLKVEQRLASGDTLEIRFVRSGGAAADAASDPLAAVVNATLPEGWSQVVQVHGDGWIVARAKLGRSQLETLVQGVGTGRR